MRLPTQPDHYDVTHERERNRILDQADADKQPLDPELTAIAALTSAADQVPYFTGPGTAALMPVSDAGRAMLAASDATAQARLLRVDDVAPKLEPRIGYPDDLNFLLTLAGDNDGF